MSQKGALDAPFELAGPIYKYGSFSSVYGSKNLETLVSQGNAWFSGVEKFNDIFECLPIFGRDVTRKHALKRYETLKNASFIDLQTDQDREVWLKIKDVPISQIRSKFSREFLHKTLLPNLFSTAREHFGSTGICSFSKTATSSTMWAYYGDAHTGYCVELSRDETPRASFLFEEVRYSEFRPKISPTEIMPDGLVSALSWETIRKFIATKSIDWQHEREVRLLLRNQTDCYAPTLGFKVSGLHAGVRISDQNLRLLKSLAGSLNLPIHQMRVSGETFDLEYS